MQFETYIYEWTLVTLCAGETTRKGFYVYDDRRKASPDPEIKKYIEKAREMSGVTIDPKVSLSLSHPRPCRLLMNATVEGFFSNYILLLLNCFGLDPAGKTLGQGHYRDDFLPCGK